MFLLSHINFRTLAFFQFFSRTAADCVYTNTRTEETIHSAIGLHRPANELKRFRY